MQQPPDLPGDPGPTSTRQARTGRPVVAWVLIVAMATLIILTQLVPQESLPGDDDPVGMVMMRIQSQYMVGVSRFLGNGEEIHASAKALNTGTLGQQQRFVILTAELAGAEEAARVLAGLEELLFGDGGSAASTAFAISESQREIQQILGLLYTTADDLPGATDATLVDRIERLTAEQRALFSSELGWFGDLALAPEGSDETIRETTLVPARRVAVATIAAVGLLVLAGLAGAAGLIVLAVATFKGRVRGGLPPSDVPHGLYAETFAVWMALFLLLQLAAGLGAALLPQAALFLSLLAFAGSLVALGWPVLRGVRFSDVRRDVGLSLGEKPALEPLVGAGGYLMALPLLAIGVGMTLVFMLIQAAFSAAPEPFTAAGGPAHPIVVELPGASFWTKLSVFLLASVAAPIVEETMFRGVLYRHLRDATRRHGRMLSVLLSASLNAFLFAAIHPQGWVAIPALMALAYSFILLREWRGTLIPSMIAHGLSNGVVMTLLLTLLSG